MNRKAILTVSLVLQSVPSDLSLTVLPEKMMLCGLVPRAEHGAALTFVTPAACTAPQQADCCCHTAQVRRRTFAQAV